MILAPALLGVSENTAGGGCQPSNAQGVDALVFELPARARVTGAPVRVTGRDPLGLHDLDVTFYSEDCESRGRLAEASDEHGPLPAGTRFVVVTERTGLFTTVNVVVG